MFQIGEEYADEAIATLSFGILLRSWEVVLKKDFAIKLSGVGTALGDRLLYWGQLFLVEAEVRRGVLDD